MKILHIIDSGGLYGAEVMLLNLMSEQVAMGLEPVLASIGDPGSVEKPLEAEARRRGLPIKSFRMRPGPNIWGALDILQFARREKCDLLHSHGYKGNILFGFIPRMIRKLPMVTTIHGWTWNGRLNKMGLYEWLDRLSLRFIDEVVLVSDTMRLKINRPRLYVVNNGIPPAQESSASQTPPDSRIAAFCQGGYTIGAIGRLSAEKGFDILLDSIHEVAKKNPEVRLVILGEGEQRVVLEAKIRRLGLEDRVLMPGYVSDAKRYLSLFRTYVLSSLTEGLPMVILEAMQAGVPILATRVGGVPEVLENGEAGLLVNPSDPVELAEGLVRLIKEPDLCRWLVDKALQTVKEKYSSKRVAGEYQEIYDGLVKLCIMENNVTLGSNT